MTLSIVIAFVFGALFWLGVDAFSYAAGERAERARRIRVARQRDHGSVPRIK